MMSKLCGLIRICSPVTHCHLPNETQIISCLLVHVIRISKNRSISQSTMEGICSYTHIGITYLAFWLSEHNVNQLVFNGFNNSNSL